MCEETAYVIAKMCYLGLITCEQMCSSIYVINAIKALSDKDKELNGFIGHFLLNFRYALLDNGGSVEINLLETVREMLLKAYKVQYAKIGLGSTLSICKVIDVIDRIKEDYMSYITISGPTPLMDAEVIENARLVLKHAHFLVTYQYVKNLVENANDLISKYSSINST